VKELMEGKGIERPSAALPWTKRSRKRRNQRKSTASNRRWSYETQKKEH
jgi:hypothetical protein